MSQLPVVPHWIDGAERPSTSGRTAPVFDPALGVETKHVALANQAEILEAIASAKAAFPAWRDASLAKRQQIIFKFRELLNERKGELAEIITSEHGKVLSDAMGEITRGQEVVEFACGLNQMLKGDFGAGRTDQRLGRHLARGVVAVVVRMLTDRVEHLAADDLVLQVGHLFRQDQRVALDDLVDPRAQRVAGAHGSHALVREIDALRLGHVMCSSRMRSRGVASGMRSRGDARRSGL